MKKKKIPNKFHLQVQTRYRTLIVPSKKKYDRNKVKREKIKVEE